MLTVRFFCSYFFFYHLSNGYTFIYDTENAPSVQNYDCIYSDHAITHFRMVSSKFCRQLVKNQILERDFNQSCHHGGQLWTFEQLINANISVFDVLKWNSSIEQVSHYARYLSNIYLMNGKENFLCQCLNPFSFGKFCEYQYFYDYNSLEQVLNKLNEKLTGDEKNIGNQLHNNRPCYVTFECDSELKCLDWRSICDGKQQCMGGIDEDYCELLEFNECNEDEYRCANGMCIPEEYWLDAFYDCMDFTDELDAISNGAHFCFFERLFDCDEHLCPYDRWSCGNGQCIDDATNRYTGFLNTQSLFCFNLRDIHYICDSVTRNGQKFWTINEGYCLPFQLPYQTLSLDNTSKRDPCAYALKCVLTVGLDENCQCHNLITCKELISKLCDTNRLFLPYPSELSLPTPYAKFMYNRSQSRDWRNKIPDKIQYRGHIKCRGYQLTSDANVSIDSFNLQSRTYYFFYAELEKLICNGKFGGHYNYSNSYYDLNCWNNSKTFNNDSYQVSFLCETRCISKYRVRDGVKDCMFNEESFTINNSCTRIQKHRLQCSSSELSCLLADTIGNYMISCSNKRDEFDSELQKKLYTNVDCLIPKHSNCIYLRNYIQKLSQNITNNFTKPNINLIKTPRISFHSYCDSLLDSESGFDESPEFCQQWICHAKNYQCLSGQCIPVDWICDGDWDCNDGSDEERIFIISNLTQHNSKLIDLNEMKAKCRKLYHVNNTPFSNICDISTEYPCLRNNVDNPLNLTANRPCINLTQIGDGHIDCLTGYDERNRLQCQNLYMLGYDYLLTDGTCRDYRDVCNNKSLEMSINSTICFYQRLFLKNGTLSNCNNPGDVLCLNDTCIKGARCNGKIECFYGEDEYRCLHINKTIIYRFDKTNNHVTLSTIVKLYPLVRETVIETTRTTTDLTSTTSKIEDTNIIARVYEKQNLSTESTYEIVRRSLPDGMITFEKDYLPFVCNHGVPVKYYTGHTICLCPSNVYGSQCEFFSDRITIITHLDLTNYHFISHQQIEIIKILITFLFNEQTILDHTEFHVNPLIENENFYIKFVTTLVYPRSGIIYQLKQFNRTNTRLFDVRFEAFNLYSTDRIEPIGVWKYPIDFDFLPSYRLSKILRFSKTNEICFNNNDICGKHGRCLKILNTNFSSSYFCSCHSGFYGEHCEIYDNNCDNYCSNNSICKPKYNKQYPLCLCSASTFGHSCHLKNDKCQKNPCQNGGTCIINYNPQAIIEYTCICTVHFEGYHCEKLKGFVHLQIESKSSANNIAAATFLYAEQHTFQISLIIRHQQLYNHLPSNVTLMYDTTHYSLAPSRGHLKIYRNTHPNIEPEYYILYHTSRHKNIDLLVNLTTENYCPTVEILWYSLNISNNTFNSQTAVSYYHRFCQAQINKTSFMCFRDSNYICLCTFDFYFASCDLFNHSTDRCSLCLSNGYCIKGDLDKPNDFLCLCPRCHSGKQCQYSNEFLSYTLDSLIALDIQNNSNLFTSIYITITLIIFLLGLFNNLCSFVTFIRRKSQQFGIGIYLLIISILDQCSLLFLLLKVIHIILGSQGHLFYYENFNQISCKIISYCLSIFTRITYWLTSFVTLKRLYLALFPTSTVLKNIRLPFIIILPTICIISTMHIHEILHYTTTIDYSYTSANITLCVMDYTESIILNYNRVNVIIHYVVPYLIQIISITLMIIQTACSRTRSTGHNQKLFRQILKKQFQSQKELYITPLIIIFSSLPQIILSFLYACDELEKSWQRYSFLITYFLSYLPQILGFILYVLPSTTFANEFRQTFIGKKILRRRNEIRKKR